MFFLEYTLMSISYQARSPHQINLAYHKYCKRMHACHRHGASQSVIVSTLGSKRQSPLRCIHACDKEQPNAFFVENGEHDFPREMKFDENRKGNYLRTVVFRELRWGKLQAALVVSR
jgi:hypothetical protein